MSLLPDKVAETINRDIVELLSEDELENQVTQSDESDMNIRRGVRKVSK